MKIGIVGCAGRMGRMLVAQVLATPIAKLAGGTEPAGSPFIGQDVAVLGGGEPCGILVSDDAEALFESSDVIIDFTVPAATVIHASLAEKTDCAMVVGTTGLDADQQAHLEVATNEAAIVQAANYSVGLNLLLGLTEQVASVLDESYDAEIVEMHHRHKIDAPSGTALAIGIAAARGRGVDLDDVAVKTRDGITGARKAGDIGFATLRGGSVIGEHTIMFASELERIELTHKASDRSVFAAGAVRAALWAGEQQPGLYTMRHVLGFDAV